MILTHPRSIKPKQHVFLKKWYLPSVLIWEIFYLVKDNMSYSSFQSRITDLLISKLHTHTHTLTGNSITLLGVEERISANNPEQKEGQGCHFILLLLSFIFFPSSFIDTIDPDIQGCHFKKKLVLWFYRNLDKV